MDHQAIAQLLGNYGEFVGAIAVVLTLFYLAIQIRQNTKQSRLDSYQTSTQRYASLISNVLEDSTKFAAFKSALDDYSSSDPWHQAVFHSQVNGIITAISHSQELFAAGTISEEPLIAQKKDLARVLKSPGGQEWMRAQGVYFASEIFHDALEIGADERPLNQMSFFQKNSTV